MKLNLKCSESKSESKEVHLTEHKAEPGKSKTEVLNKF